MSDQNAFPLRGWLPTLNAEDRFSSDADPESGPGNQQSTTAVHSEPEESPESDRGRSGLVVHDWSGALEAQFGLTAPAGPPAVHESFEPGEQIARLQDRLDYYEHFDALIKDNISRSAALFQAVFEEREKAKSVQSEAESTMNAVAIEADRRVESERKHVQNILMTLMDEATFLHQRSDALIQRLAEALTELAPLSDEDDEPVAGA